MWQTGEEFLMLAYGILRALNAATDSEADLGTVLRSLQKFQYGRQEPAIRFRVRDPRQA
jgi:hypothetical protein